MAYISPVMLERLFFRAFFASLAAKEFNTIAWRSDETDLRFRKVYEHLRARERSPNLNRLLNQLRPDPITGSHPALDANLMHMQPGYVEAPNPDYEGVRLSASKDEADRRIEKLPDEIREFVREAAQIFIAGT
jgi:hypothetical protein